MGTSVGVALALALVCLPFMVMLLKAGACFLIWEWYLLSYAQVQPPYWVFFGAILIFSISRISGGVKENGPTEYILETGRAAAAVLLATAVAWFIKVLFL